MTGDYHHVRSIIEMPGYKQACRRRVARQKRECSERLYRVDGDILTKPQIAERLGVSIERAGNIMKACRREDRLTWGRMIELTQREKRRGPTTL